MARPGTLSVVYPMWNEESSIHMAVDAAREAATALIEAGEIGDYEIVIVDDASTDATPAVADALAEADRHITVVHHEVNKGLGGTIKTGFSKASGDVVLYTDADLPCDLLETLPKALRLMRVYEADVVSAYRHDRTAEGPRRAVYSFVYNLLVRYLFDLRVRDVNFAFKVVRRRVLDHVSLESEGSFIDAELLVKAHRFGFHIIQFGVDYFPRTRGVSTLSSNATIVKIVRELRQMRTKLMSLQPLPSVTGETTTDPEPAATAGRRRRRHHRHRRPREHDGPTLLIVNADDYGLTESVSKGILRAHRDGVLTSTSVLALAPAFEQTAPWLLDEPGLGVGVHLALVGEDPPVLSAAEIPTLVDRRGRLPVSWRQLLPKAAAGRIDPADVRRELEAQLERVQATGLHIDHLDTHQHLHLWPLVREVVLDLATTAGIGAVRVPRSTGLFPGKGVALLASQLERQAASRWLAFPGAAAGLDEAGAMTKTAFLQALQLLAESDCDAVELSCHPGEAEDPDRWRYRWNYRWGEELDTLLHPATRAAIEAHGFRLGTYGDLTELAASR